MQILIAEDSPVHRRLLEITLGKWGYEVVAACDGDTAWHILERDGGPPLVILDWEMPGMNGVEVCHKIRQAAHLKGTHVILLTGRGSKSDVLTGLRAGADDYVTKPFDADELRARVRIGARMVELRRALSDRVHELEQALSRVKQLQGLLPICSYCKKIRDDKNYWQQVETYVGRHSEAQFTHAVCPTCLERVKAELKRTGTGGPSPASAALRAER